MKMHIIQYLLNSLNISVNKKSGLNEPKNLEYGVPVASSCITLIRGTNQFSPGADNVAVAAQF